MSEKVFEFKAGSMGTGFIFKIADYRSEDHAIHFCKLAMEIIEDANQRFSTYIPDSELSLINSGQLTIEKASATQRDIWDKAEEFKALTDGFFDARSPEGLFDPSGIVKSWAAANAVNFLQANGFRRFTLNAGGDVLLSEELADSPLTRVGISNLESIASEDSFINMVLELDGTNFRAVATSGSSERGEHIWRKDQQFSQVTVVAKDLVVADVWATTLIAGGQQAIEMLPANVVALSVSDDGSLKSTPNFFQLLAKV